MNVGVIGLGKLGLPLACWLKSHLKSGSVWGYDIHEPTIDALQSGSYTTWEPDCDYSGIRFTALPELFALNTDMAFLCVNTPTKSNGEWALRQIESACADLRSNLDNSKPYSLVVCSTVPPGTCRDVIQPLVGKDVAVYSMPVWVALGSVVHDLNNPPMIVMGYDGEDFSPSVAKIMLSAMKYGNVGPMQALRTDTRTAEWIKLIHNAWCCTKMSFINQLGADAELLGLNVGDVSRFFQNGGERPGKFWAAGAPFSGPCFPRDLALFTRLTGNDIADSARGINRDMINYLVETIPIDARVLILGASYKHGVPVIEGSLAVELAERLTRSGNGDSGVRLTDDDPSGEWDYCIVVHKELRHLIPENCEVIDLWAK